MANRGIVRIQIERRGDRSVVIDQYSQAPLQLSKPLYLDGADFPTMYLRSPSSGLLEGDVHEIDIQVGVNAQFELRTQGAALVYPGESRLQIEIRLNDHARFEYLPHPLILASEAKLDQSIQVRMSENSSLLFKESWVCGRIAMGEEWLFKQFDNLIEIFEADALAYRECWSIQPHRDQLTNPLICGSYKHFATTFDIGSHGLNEADKNLSVPELQLRTRSEFNADSDAPLVAGNGHVSNISRWSLRRGRATIQREAIQL